MGVQGFSRGSLGCTARLLAFGAHERAIPNLSGRSRSTVTRSRSKRILRNDHQASRGRYSTLAHDTLRVDWSDSVSRFAKASRQHWDGSDGHLYFWETVPVRNASSDRGLTSAGILQRTVRPSESFTDVVLRLSNLWCSNLCTLPELPALM